MGGLLLGLVALLGVLAAPVLGHVAPSYDLPAPRWLLVASAAAGVVVAGALAAVMPGELVPAGVALGIAAPTLFYVDLRTKKLPNAVVYPLFALSAVVVAVAGFTSDGHAAVRGFIVSAAFFAAAYVLMFVTGAIGFGDVKLAGALGLSLGYLGYGYAYLAFLAFAAVAALHAVVLIARGYGRKAEFPVGPSILVGAVLAVLIGGPVIEATLGSYGLA